MRRVTLSMIEASKEAHIMKTKTEGEKNDNDTKRTGYKCIGPHETKTRRGREEKELKLQRTNRKVNFIVYIPINF